MESPHADQAMDSAETREVSVSQTHQKPSLSHPEGSRIETSQDSGPIPPTWSQDLLNRYNTDLTKLDEQEESLLERLAALQKLQRIWAAAGRSTEMERSNKRLKTGITKIAFEDERLSRKRTRLEEATAALKNVLGMLDDADSSGDGGAGD